MSNFAATVNAAPAYLVNDIYKRYINPHATQKRYVWLSYLASFGVVVVGLTFGLFTQSINSIVTWIVSGLWGGYVVSNVLKWYWWRFNGWGYFWGMAVGIGSAVIMATPYVLPDVRDINKFPIILVVSLVAALLGTFLTKPDPADVLKEFYRRVRPWGFWGPIRDQVMKEDPAFQRNKDFFRDMFNICVGTVWQTCFIVMAIFLVTRHFANVLIALVLLVITSVILKFNWYDKLPAPSPDPVAEPQSPPAAH